jgi:hypothetical protein
MQDPQRIRVLALASMVWSVLGGAGALLLLRLIQTVAGSGHPGAFPVEVLAFYVGVEILLAVVLWGVLQRHRRASMALALLLALIVPTTVVGTRGWSPDFLPIALGMEAVWLAPWLFTAYTLWRS